MDNLTAFKNLYVAFGGSSDTVASMTVTCDVVAALATLIGSTGGMLPAVTTTNNGKIMKVVSGKWELAADAT